jgi:hypothetical protein
MRFPAITCSQPFSAVAIFLIETVTNVFPKFWGSHCVANIHGVYGAFPIFGAIADLLNWSTEASILYLLIFVAMAFCH